MNKELLKAIDPIARRFGFYTSYTLSESEFVGTAPYALPGTHWYLQKNGYEDNPTFMGITLEAAKTHPKTGKVHDWSYRKVDPENPRKQFHIHGWKRDYEKGPEHAYDEIASHREYRPDFKRVSDESYSEMYDRLRTHYRPEYGTDYERGEMCDELESLVS